MEIKILSERKPIPEYDFDPVGNYEGMLLSSGEMILIVEGTDPCQEKSFYLVDENEKCPPQFQKLDINAETIGDLREELDDTFCGRVIKIFKKVEIIMKGIE